MKIEDKFCPICNKKMWTNDKIKYTEFSCIQDEHTYACRYVEDTFNHVINMTKIKLRVGNKNNISYYLKVNYDYGFSEVWSKDSASKKDVPRAKINQIVNIDFNDLEKIKTKIKTLLVFS